MVYKDYDDAVYRVTPYYFAKFIDEVREKINLRYLINVQRVVQNIFVAIIDSSVFIHNTPSSDNNLLIDKFTCDGQNDFSYFLE